MSFRQTIESWELLDSATVDGARVVETLVGRGLEVVSTTRVEAEQGFTDYIRVLVPGREGRSSGGTAPTLGIIGKLGGIGARPKLTGLVSDADGAITAIACALKLADMRSHGDLLSGDVVITTHICPAAPTRAHDPVPFMSSPIPQSTMLEHEVSAEMEAILSVDATKGNRILNHKGIAITPTIKEGYILRVSEDLLNLLSYVTGENPVVLPITTQDITPYGNGLHHLNSIVQPCTATAAPVVGVATTAAVAVPGCATGANYLSNIEMAVRFCLEVAKAFGAGQCSFHDPREWQLIQSLYGSLRHLQTAGRHTV